MITATVCVPSGVACAQAEPEPHPEIYGQVQAAHDKSGSVDEPVSVRIIEDPKDAIHAKEREALADQHNFKDLYIQQQAAAAAEASATWAYWQTLAAGLQTVFAVLGTAILLYTLWLTRQSNRIALEEVKASLRAYIGVQHVVLQPLVAGEFPTASARLKNFGQTHARNLKCTIVMDIGLPDSRQFDVDQVEPEDPGRLLNDQGHALWPGAESDQAVRRHVPAPSDWVPLVNAGAACVWVWGRLTYCDVFGDHHQTDFRFVVGGDNRPAAYGSMRFDHAGNDAS